MTTLISACVAIDFDEATADRETDRQMVMEVFQRLDNISLPTDLKLLDYTRDAVILVPDEKEIRGLDEIEAHLSTFGNGVELQTKHSIVELTSFEEIIAVQGRVTGTARPHDQNDVFQFETKNLILFRRTSDDQLKVWKVIYNSAPVGEIDELAN
ncbi:MAG: Cif family virulence factor [Henriciella sp.]